MTATTEKQDASLGAPGARAEQASADSLPFPDAAFSAVAMSVVFFFFDDPVAMLRECRRVLVFGGHVAIYTTSPKLRGTPAAPEPIASRGHFYDDEELRTLTQRSGFVDARVVNDDGGQMLTASA